MGDLRGGWKSRQSHVTETAPSHLLITFLAFSATNRFRRLPAVRAQDVPDVCSGVSYALAIYLQRD